MLRSRGSKEVSGGDGLERVSATANGDTSCGGRDAPRRDRLLLNQGRCRIARTNRAFNGGRQARRGPVAGQNEVVEPRPRWRGPRPPARGRPGGRPPPPAP